MPKILRNHSAWPGNVEQWMETHNAGGGTTGQVFMESKGGWRKPLWNLRGEGVPVKGRTKKVILYTLTWWIH